MPYHSRDRYVLHSLFVILQEDHILIFLILQAFPRAHSIRLFGRKESSTRHLAWILIPQTAGKVQAAMNEFTLISVGAAIINYLGVIDGYLLRIKVPSKEEAGIASAMKSIYKLLLTIGLVLPILD